MYQQVSGDGKQAVVILKERGSYGNCDCGGSISYYSDYGVRCQKCKKLFGTWVQDIKKAKQEEKQRKEERAQILQLKKFDEETMI